MVTLLGFPPDVEQTAAAHGVRTAFLATHPDAATLRHIADLIDAGQIRPVVNTVLPLAEARTGYDMSQSGHTRGKIILRTRALTNVNIGARRHRVVASIQFEDNGPGVPEHLRDTLFYPLVTGRADGTGLGLAVAQDLVSRHDGLIEFES